MFSRILLAKIEKFQFNKDHLPGSVLILSRNLVFSLNRIFVSSMLFRLSRPSEKLSRLFRKKF